ncbi:MAG TPA: alkylmercury lyase family protein [Dehalococcoidia bacterium]|nr:alkylmercury lyase family protein [Dehalococcoidia bacterium]
MTLESKNIPNRWWRVKGAGLGDGELGVLRAILHGFLERGQPPAPAELRSVADAAGVGLDTALAELVRHDMLVTAAADGAILGAYPFSAVPTEHRVAILGRATVFAMCAIDALGIPYMVQRAAAITSRDAATNEPLQVQIDPVTGRAAADPPSVIVFAGSSGGEGTAAACRCPFINFFRSAEAADEYLRAHPELDGQILALDDAVAFGRRVFEDPDGLVMS